MELKWLEDFVSVARSGSFSRSAEERHVTQSAFSRRIQALETWLGVSLIDRSTYPTTLTAEGNRFRETAEEAVRTLYASRAELRASTAPRRQGVSVAALHTLALTFFPRWFRQIEERTGSLGSRLLPDSLHACLQAVVEGGFDFLLTFHHPVVPILLDPELFPHLVVGADSLVAVQSPALATDAAVPVLGYARNSLLGRIASSVQTSAATPEGATHINENALAEGLKFMALEGHGLASLPRSLVSRELEDGSLRQVGIETPLEVRLYRNMERKRPVVDSVWTAARDIADQTMHNRNKPD